MCIRDRYQRRVHGTPTDPQNSGICSDMIDLFIDMSFIYGKDDTEKSAFDDESSAVIELNTSSKSESSNTYLMLRQVEKFIALVCIVNEKDLAKKNLIDYNIDCFKKGLTDIFKVAESKKQFLSCLLYTSPSPRDLSTSRMPSSA
eukprot:TRINITY_DN9067_c0_g1_i2.p2 TRINITY_DN9067_c0_g1~~TRINITY_DN9067_c0_g1_i2.p2  ORF type:complete len:145 (+),score=33.20 TRINITY_DN9067_c0_g1_i2:183-617(+)